MYKHCFRCKRALGSNSELAFLPIGRRIAFDADKGRVWVVCVHCEQWNLTPLEERWEVFHEAEQLAARAESRAEGKNVGLARTARGLELLNVRGLDSIDIANWRYGRRLQQRRSLLWWPAGASTVLAIVLGLRAGIASGSRDLGLYVGSFAAVWLGFVWRNPPRPLLRVVPDIGSPVVLWAWQLRDIRFKIGKPTEPPILVIPRFGRDLELVGPMAAAFLAAFLPK